MQLTRKWFLFLCSVLILPAHAGVLMKPVQDPDLVYDGKLLDGTYTPQITHPDDLLGFPVGSRVANPQEIHAAIMHWSTQSDRLKVIEYARSHEGRPLVAVFISSPSLLSQLDDIQSNIGKLANPRETSDSEAAQIINGLPAIAWMAYSIHGNETSGADAALAAIYHLIASEDSAVTSLLSNMVVAIDPMMNPDGRARFAKSLEQYRGTAPNVDDQSLLHRGDWPSGRTNHYFFDLNRDFFYLTQPETIGRVALINKWRPQLMIDGHEMGSQDTYLMGPPRQPLNDNIDPNLQKWSKVFARDQSSAFDEKGWRYYTGEWFENWYPGYSNYSEYRGTMHILYEQSRMAEDGVRRPEGTVQTYIESVHHQFVSTLANLKTLAKHSKAMYEDYWQGRKNNISNKGKFANRTYVILANDNHGRTQAFVDRLLAQDIDVFLTTRDIEVSKAVNHLGETLKSTVVPKNSIVVPNRQPEAPLIAAILEFEAGVNDAVLLEERQKTLRDGSSVMYDTTAWNLTMMYGLQSLTVPEHMTKHLTPYQAHTMSHNVNDNAIAWAVDGADDRSLAFAARLMEQDVHVRFLDKEAELDGNKLNRGSIVVTVTDNPKRNDLDVISKATADELGLSVVSTGSGFGEGELPDWGGRHFRLLTKPQVAILSHGGFSSYDVGATWWSLDTHLGIRHSQIDVASLNRTDLRRYNVLVMPASWGNSLTKAQTDAIQKWVEMGGTLIASAQSAGKIASDKGIGKVRTLPSSFENAQHFDIALMREYLATQKTVNTSTVMAHTLEGSYDFPWANRPKPLKEDELTRRDKWLKLFMPSGAMIAGRTDQDHWLTVGTPPTLPLLYANQPLLMSDDNSEAIIRAGVFMPSKKTSEDDTKKKNMDWWYNMPADKALNVRMSGLVWPEAQHRIANTAYLTRERIGNGQVILFSGQPNFRGSTRGTNRLLLNAIVYGPGLGARAQVDL